MEENTNKKEKKIDIGLLLVILLILFVLALIFILVGQNTNLIYKKINDDNISIKVPFNFKTIDYLEYRKTSEKPIIKYYYIHKDYGLDQGQMMELVFQDVYPGEYSEIYSAEIGGYNALQRHYIYKRMINDETYYNAGLGTLIELEDRFLVIDLYDTLVRGEGEVMDFQDIQLELFNKIIKTLKIEDNTADMPAAENINVEFYDLELILPDYWYGYMYNGDTSISVYNNEILANIHCYLLTDHYNPLVKDLLRFAKKPDDESLLIYVDNYYMGDEEFKVYMLDWEHSYDLIAISDKYLIEFDILLDSDENSFSQETQQAMIDMLFGN